MYLSVLRRGASKNYTVGWNHWNKYFYLLLALFSLILALLVNSEPYLVQKDTIFSPCGWFFSSNALGILLITFGLSWVLRIFRSWKVQRDARSWGSRKKVGGKKEGWSRGSGLLPALWRRGAALGSCRRPTTPDWRRVTLLPPARQQLPDWDPLSAREG